MAEDQPKRKRRSWVRWLGAGLTPLLVCLFFGFCANSALGQQYPFIPIPGAPKNIKTIFQDSRGRLWLGGTDLACFDGSRFFFLRDYGFPAVDTYDVAEDSSGTIWIGAETGVYRFSRGRTEQVSNGVAVSIIAAEPDVIVATVGPPGRGIPLQTSLVRIQRSGKRWETQTLAHLDSPGPLTLDRSGMLLFPWPRQGWNEILLADVLTWRPGMQIAIRHHVARRGAPGISRLKILRDSTGCIWSGSDGAARFDCGDGWRAAPFTGAVLHANLHEASDGDMVLWGDNLLALGRPGAFRIATVANGLPALQDAIKAKDGTLWLGSPKGLYRLSAPFRIEFWTAREGVNSAPWAITRNGKKIYFGVNREIAVSDKSRRRWERLAGFQTGTVTSLLSSEDGTLWAALDPGGAVQLTTTGRVIAHTERDQPKRGMRLAETADHEIWLGGGSSLGRLVREGSTLTFQAHSFEGQQPGNVLAVEFQRQTHKLWACYNGGLLVRDQGGHWRTITTRDGLLVNGCWGFAALVNGDIWYTYFDVHDFALIKINSAGSVVVRQYGLRNRVPEPGGDTFDADKSGRLWRAGDLGIYVADPEEAEKGEWLKLDESDGFPANGINSGSYFADSDGSVWWGADNDLAHYFPPADLTKPEFAPQVFISAFSWNGGVARLSEAVDKLPHGSAVTAYIGSLQFDRRNGLRLRYRILPEQPAWRESSALNIALGQPSSGAHTLEVQGRVFTGPWSRTVKQSFTVLRPNWLAEPFLMGYAMTMILLVSGGYWLEQRRRIDRAKLLPDLAHWRMGALLPEIRELTGTLLDGRYEVRELLARGGFANVMAAYDHAQERPCAVKIFRSEIKDKASLARSFEREVAALRQIRHPNVVSIYAKGITVSGAPYLVMEFVDGESLREILSRGPLTPVRAARILRQLASALDAIHQKEICHRDVKPENILVRDSGGSHEQAVLIDFSIAIVKNADEALHGLSRAAGTFDYMAPEQAVGYAQPSSDIYSLTKVILEMLTGSRLSVLLPNAALDLSARVREVLGNLPVRFSDESIELIARSLEFDPAKRPSAAGEFANPIARDLEKTV